MIKQSGNGPSKRYRRRRYFPEMNRRLLRISVCVVFPPSSLPQHKPPTIIIIIVKKKKTTIGKDRERKAKWFL